MPIRLVALLALGLFAPVLPAQDVPQHVHAGANAIADTLDIDAIVAFVLEGPHVQPTALHADAVEAAIPAAGSLPQPSVSATVYPLAVARADLTELPALELPALQVMQRFPDLGLRRAERASATAAAEAARFDDAAFRADAAGMAVTMAIKVQRARAIRASLLEFSQRLETFEEAAAVQYEVGRGSQSSVLLAQTDRKRLDARIARTRTEEDQHLYHLVALTHLPDSLFRSTTLATDLAIPEDIAIDSAEATSPTLQSIIAQGEAATAKADAARAGLRPEFGLHAMYSPMYTMPDGATLADPLGVGLSVKVPLWREPLNARIEEAQVRVNQIEAQHHVERLHLEAGIQRQARIIAQERDILALYENELLPQAEVTVEASLSNYMTGQTNFLGLLEAERRRLEITIEAIESRSRLQEAAATLYRELGQIPVSP